MPRRYPNDWRVLTGLVREWAGEGGQQSARHAAGYVLRHGLRHGEVAGAFRREIYLWSKDPRLNTRLALVLVQMCTEVIAERHPEQAMVRLHHLAWRHRGLHAPYDALLRLAAGSQRLRRQMFYRLAQTFGRGEASDPERWQVDTELLLALCAPADLITSSDQLDSPLLDDQEFRKHLADCWGGVLPQETSVWADRVDSWLDEAALRERHSKVLLNLLVASCNRQVAVLARLYAVAYAWSLTDVSERVTPPARGHVAAQLLRMIRTARRDATR